MEPFDQLIEQFQSWPLSGLMLQILQFLFWAVLVLVLAWLARKAVNRTISDNSLRYKARKAIRFGGYILVLVVAVASFAGQMQYVTVALGLITAGIAFALQAVIQSIAGWVAILSGGIYKPGDRIEMNGVKGDVIDIGITKTTLMEIGEWVSSDNYSGRIVKLSNAFVFKGPVRNYSTDFPFVWDEINLPVKYGSDVRLANELILGAARHELVAYAGYARDHWKRLVKIYLIEDAHVDPTLTMQLTDNWIAFNLRYVVDYKKRRSTKHQLYSEIRQAIEETQGKVELASATFELVGWPDMNVRLSEPGK